ncbi:putative WPP domain-containing protein/3 [Helianthus debilis subsp. tardiflorus]
MFVRPLPQTDVDLPLLTLQTYSHKTHRHNKTLAPLLHPIPPPLSSSFDRYDTVPTDEATGFARNIENEAFNAVPASPGTDGDDDVTILQLYSKEIRKRMLDFVKSRFVESVNDGAAVDAAAGDGGMKEEEGSTVEA